MKIKALTVEDNDLLRNCIVDMLENEGYEVYASADMQRAKELFKSHSPHIVLLDIMLPEGNGYNLIDSFREQNDSHILMLTALDNDESKCLAYEYGADDYITKPFDLNELIYKLSAIRRRILSNQEKFKIGDIVFDTASNMLSSNEKAFYIQPSQMKLLKYLYIKYLEDTYFPRNGLAGMHGVVLEEGSRIQTLIARLRKNLSDINSERVSIETIYGKGYKLNVVAPKGKSDV